MKSRTKLSEKLEEIYSYVYQEIRVLSMDIWQRLKVHTAFFLSTAVQEGLCPPRESKPASTHFPPAQSEIRYIETQLYRTRLQRGNMRLCSESIIQTSMFRRTPRRDALTPVRRVDVRARAVERVRRSFKVLREH